MIRTKLLAKSSHVAVLRTDHAESDQHDTEEEVCSNSAINFVEAGQFGLRTESTNRTLSSGCVFLSKPGSIHRYTHFEDTPSDVCLSVIYSKGFGVNGDYGEEVLPTALPDAFTPSNRLGFLKFRLKRIIADDYPLALEDWAAELLWTAHVGLPDRARPYRERQLNWYAGRIEAAREMFEKHYAEPHTLISTAKSVAMSPFHFARVFSQLVGVPPHQYLLRVRLEAGRRMLLDGQAVTRICFEVGFSNLSHFTRSFQRRFGCSPSTFKSQRNRH